MAQNEKFGPTRARSLPVPDDTKNGGPVLVGLLCGVALSRPGAAGNAPGHAMVDLDGAFSLDVSTSTTLAVGDPVYITPGNVLTPSDGGGVNKLFGTALSVKGSAPGKVLVELVGAPSVAASGGGVLLNGAQYYFEINNGLDAPADTPTDLTWDTVHGISDGYLDYSGDMTYLALTAGCYLIDGEIDVDNPAQDRYAITKAIADSLISPSFQMQQSNGQHQLPSVSDRSPAICFSGGIVVPDRTDRRFYVSLRSGPVVNTGSPADLHINYAYLTLTKIG